MTVSNLPPVVEAGAKQTVDEGAAVSLTGATFTDASAADTHTARIDWGDRSEAEAGTVSESGGSGSVSGSHVYADDGTYTVTVCVTDDDSDNDCDTFLATVRNVAPVATIDAIRDETAKVIGVDALVALIGLRLELAGRFHDLGTLDTHTASINWGEATIVGVVIEAPFGPPGSIDGLDGSVVASYVYVAPGDYIVKLTVTDNDGGVGTRSLAIAVMDASDALTTTTDDLADILLDPNLKRAAAKAIQKAIDNLIGNNGGQAANGAVDKLAQGDLTAALVKIGAAIQYLEDAEAADASLFLTNEKSLLALSAKSVAVQAIAVAEAAATKPKDRQKVAQAKALVAAGDGLLAGEDYVGVVGNYRGSRADGPGHPLTECKPVRVDVRHAGREHCADRPIPAGTLSDAISSLAKPDLRDLQDLEGQHHLVNHKQTTPRADGSREMSRLPPPPPSRDRPPTPHRPNRPAAMLPA